MEENKDLEQKANIDAADEQSDNNGKGFTQEEVDALIEKRLARERKKAEKQKADDDAEKSKTAEQKAKEKADKLAKEQSDKVNSMSQKLVCYDNDVPKTNVNKVIKLANTYVDDETDFEKAVAQVKTDFPFLFETEKEGKPTTTGKKTKNGADDFDGVEAAFYKRNPELK